MIGRLHLTNFHALLALKLIVAGVCIWLATTLVPKDQWRSLLDHTGGFAVLVIAWAVNQVLCATRLWVIMRSVGYDAKLGSIIQITFSSFLVGSVLPGAIAQDVAKIALIRTATRPSSAPQSGLPKIVLVIVADRVMGLLSLWLVSFVLSFAVTLPDTLLAGLLIYSVRFVGLLVLAAIAFAFVTKLFTRTVRTRAMGQRIDKLIALVDLFISRRTFKAVLLSAGPLSILAVSILVLAQAEVGGQLMVASGQPANILTQAFLAPAFVLVSALPLAPLGIGVGQLSLATIYEIGGLPVAVGVLLATSMQLCQILTACTLGLPVLISLRAGGRAKP